MLLLDRVRCYCIIICGFTSRMCSKYITQHTPAGDIIVLLIITTLVENKPPSISVVFIKVIINHHRIIDYKYSYSHRTSHIVHCIHVLFKLYHQLSFNFHFQNNIFRCCISFHLLCDWQKYQRMEEAATIETSSFSIAWCEREREHERWGQFFFLWQQ